MPKLNNRPSDPNRPSRPNKPCKPNRPCNPNRPHEPGILDNGLILNNIDNDKQLLENARKWSKQNYKTRKKKGWFANIRN